MSNLISRADVIEAVRLETGKHGRELLGRGDILDIISALPSVEVETDKVIRCRDCRYLNRKDSFGSEWKECTNYKYGHNHHVKLNDYCSWGERLTNQTGIYERRNYK